MRASDRRSLLALSFASISAAACLYSVKPPAESPDASDDAGDAACTFTSDADIPRVRATCDGGGLCASAPDAAFCQADAAKCVNPNQSFLECSAPSDCDVASKCCLSGSVGATCPLMVSTQFSTSCAKSCPFVLCATKADCQTSQSCVPAKTAVGTIALCL